MCDKALVADKPPFNVCTETLVQVKRTGESSWQEKNILPVSFAMLVQPSSRDPVQEVTLPDYQPGSLQALSRTRIRRVLRQLLEREHPSLGQVRRATPAAKKKKQQLRRRVQRIVIPIFEESDDSSSHHDQSNDEERRPGATEGTPNGEDPMEVSDPRKRAAQDSDAEARFGGGAVAYRSGNPSVVWKRVAFDELNLQLVGLESDAAPVAAEAASGGSSGGSNAEEEAPAPPELSYSTLMRQRIVALPLPPRLKEYLNYDRPL
ncbi:protein-L-isoaspartate O-methyltransferase domain-containing protein 1 isoform X2 [Ixodes scapularis]